MERFHARFCDAGRVLFGQVDGILIPEVNGPGSVSGQFDIHQGGILATEFATDRPYRLVFDNDSGMTVQVTKVHSSNSAGIAVVKFRGTWEQADSDSVANPHDGHP